MTSRRRTTIRCNLSSNFLCSDMIFDAESRNSDQECLDVTSVSSDVTPLVLGAVKDSESTVDISIQPSVRGRLFKCIDFWRTFAIFSVHFECY